MSDGTRVCADCGDPGAVGDGLRIKGRGEDWAWVCLDDEACELRETVRDLRACLTAADALARWLDYGVSHAWDDLVTAYDKARVKVQP